MAGVARLVMSRHEKLGLPNSSAMAILSGLELLRKRVPDDPQIVRLLDNSREAAERGTALIQRILAFARRQELKAERTDVARLVAGMTELLQRSLGPTLTIETRFPADLPPVTTDVNQLEMAILNLAVNARDAMGEGGTLSIMAERREVGDLAAGCYVQLTVADTGQGMDEETLCRAAEPFFTTKGVGKGTGLGLSMVHGFARQLGRTLEIESQPDAGTRIHLWLRADEAVVDPIGLGRPAPEPSPTQSRPPSSSSTTIPSC